MASTGGPLPPPTPEQLSSLYYFYLEWYHNSEDYMEDIVHVIKSITPPMAIAQAWGRFKDAHPLLAEEIEAEQDADPEPRCDLCGEPDGPGEPDWNGETGNHKSCEVWNAQ